MEKVSKSERIYQRHLEQKRKPKPKVNNAAIAREFHCSREWVRRIIEREHQRRAGLLLRAAEIARENINANDSLNGD